MSFETSRCTVGKLIQLIVLVDGLSCTVRIHADASTSILGCLRDAA